MQMFRPSNERYEQSYEHVQSTIKPFFGPKPTTGYGGSNNLTQCFDARLPAAGSGYGMHQYAAGSQGYAGPQKPYGQYAQHGSSYSSVQHGGNGGATHGQGSYGSMMQGGGYGGSTQHANLAHHGPYATGHQQGGGGGGGYGYGFARDHGSTGCELGQSGGYSYSMKKRERRSWGRKRSGNDSDSSGSDESDNDKC